MLGKALLVDANILVRAVLGKPVRKVMIRHVKSFNGSKFVPVCDHWDYHEKCPLPRGPYLVRAPRHPSALSVQGIRRRLWRVSEAADARNSDGTPLHLQPHDCRRVFATEHLNNHTPVHVIQRSSAMPASIR